jgi:hypothetical protein
VSTSAERMRRLRARRRALLNPPPDGVTLRDADSLVLPAVEQAIAALELGPSDVAAAQLARQYARTLDTARDPAWAYRWIGPLLQVALEQLGATPAARSRLKTGKPPEREPSRLDALRAAHNARRL